MKSSLYTHGLGAQLKQIIYRAEQQITHPFECTVEETTIGDELEQEGETEPGNRCRQQCL